MQTCGKSDVFHQANCTKRRTRFLLVSKNVNALYRSVLTSNGSLLYIAQTQHFCESQIPKIKSEASVVINLFFKKYIYLSMSSSYFHQSDPFYQSVCTTFMLLYFTEFFLRCLFLFLFMVLLCFFCCFYSFQFCFYFWPNFQPQQ